MPSEMRTAPGPTRRRRELTAEIANATGRVVQRSSSATWDGGFEIWNGRRVPWRIAPSQWLLVLFAVDTSDLDEALDWVRLGGATPFASRNLSARVAEVITARPRAIRADAGSPVPIPGPADPAPGAASEASMMTVLPGFVRY